MKVKAKVKFKDLKEQEILLDVETVEQLDIICIALLQKAIYVTLEGKEYNRIVYNSKENSFY